MLYIADQWEERYFTEESLQNFSCEALRQIDKRWYDYPKRQGHFGFRVQKQIWESPEIGSPTINSPIEDWRKFYIRVGWKTEESGRESSEGYVSYDSLGAFKDINHAEGGNLPTWKGDGFPLPRWWVDGSDSGGVPVEFDSKGERGLVEAEGAVEGSLNGAVVSSRELLKKVEGIASRYRELIMFQWGVKNFSLFSRCEL